VPAHLGAPIAATGADFRRAFSFLEEGVDTVFAGNLEAPPLSGDAQFLEDISQSLIELGSVGKPDAAVERFRAQRRAAAGIGGVETDTSGQTEGAAKTDGWGPFRNR